MNESARENRLRRLAKRHDLCLQKARTRNWQHPAWGTYRLIDSFRNALEFGDMTTGYGCSLDEIEEHLKGLR